ncbi:MAG: hypothetical protein KAS48_08020 [Gammaproteobacteria bacterium]|nr:hypothetical protein [Gammaproteobacteria bacterium]
MPKWNDEKTKVKEIFDAIRNFGLAGVVLYTGVYSLTLPPSFQLVNYFQILTGVSLILLSIYLFWINAVSFNKTVREEHFAGNVGSLFYYIVPALIIMLGVNLLSSTAFPIKLGSDKTLGNSTIKELIEDNPAKNKHEP